MEGGRGFLETITITTHLVIPSKTLQQTFIRLNGVLEGK